MADENVPLSWYAILKAELDNIQPYLDVFELMKDPRLELLEVNGQKYCKLIYSAFDRYVDYEGVLNETRELVALLTGALRIGQRPAPLAIVNIMRVLANGREEKFPPHGRPVRIVLDLMSAVKVRKPGIQPRPTIEQYMMEHVIRSDDWVVRDVLHYLSNPPDFFNLYKILELISLDLGKGSKRKGFSLIENRGWATKTAWNKNRPAPQMDLQEAFIMSTPIIKEWVAERAGLQLLPPAGS
jgi:hypothetical protein